MSDDLLNSVSQFNKEREELSDLREDIKSRMGPGKTTFAEDVRIGVSNVLQNVNRAGAETVNFLMDKNPGYNLYQKLAGEEDKPFTSQEDIAKGNEYIDTGLVVGEAKKKDPGVAGAVVQGLTSVAGTTALSIANPAYGIGMAYTQAYGSARNAVENLKKQGVSEDAANKVGWMMGISEAIAQLIPGYGGAAGKALAAKAVPTIVGGGVNTVQGFVANNYAYRVIAGDGNPEIAEMFNPYDPKNWLTDLATGSVPVAVRTGYRAAKDHQIVKQITPKLDSLKQSLQAEAKARKAALASMPKKQGRLELEGGQAVPKQPEQAWRNAQGEVIDRGRDTPAFKDHSAEADDTIKQMNLLDDDPISVILDAASVLNPKNPKEADLLNKANKSVDSALARMKQEHLASIEREQARERRIVNRGGDEPLVYKEWMRSNMRAKTRADSPTVGWDNQLSRWMEVTNLTEAKDLTTGDISKARWTSAKGMVGRLRNNLASGVQGLAQITNHPYLKYAAHVINEADRVTQNFVSRRVHPLADTYQKMTDTERVEVIRALQLGDEYQQEVNPKMLQQAGISERGQEFIKNYYNINKDFLRMHNNNLLAEGKDPIEAREGHVPSRWKGEYVTYAVDKKTGQLATVVIEPTFYQSMTAQRWLKKHNPNLIFSEISGKDTRTMHPDTLRIGIDKMKNILGQLPDNKTKEMLEAASMVLQAGNVESARRLYSFNQHELFKLGVDGYLGNRKWQDEVQNANDMFKSMVEYWEQGSISSNYMQVGRKIQQAIKDVEYEHPNVAELLNEIYQHNIMQRPNNAGEAMDRMLALPGIMTGLGANAVKNSAARVGNAMQMMTLGMYNAKFAAVQLGAMLQQGLPNLQLVADAVKADPKLMASETLAATMKNAFLTVDRKKGLSMLDDAEQKAIKYAEDRGMLTFSEFEYVRSFGETATKRSIQNLGNQSLAITDKLTRPAVYLAAFNLMRKSGYPQELAMETAASITQSAMVDYRQNMRAMLYNKHGTVGREASRLRSFIHGYTTNNVAMAKADKKAFAMSMMTLGLMAGTLGIPGVELADDIYRKMFGKSAFDSLGENTVREIIEFGAVSGISGMWFQPSFSMSHPFPDRDQKVLEWLFPYHSKAYKALSSGLEFMTDPRTSTAGNFAIDAAPLAVRGAIVEDFKRDKDNYKLDRRGTRENAVPMTDREWNWYRFGVSSTKLGIYQQRKWKFESNLRDQNKEIAETARKITNAYLDGEYHPKELQEDIKNYAETAGYDSFKRLAGAIRSQLVERNLTRSQKLTMRAKNSDRALIELLQREEAGLLAREREHSKR